MTVGYSDALGADIAVLAVERGYGCTAARELSRRWYATSECARGQLGARCVVLGSACASDRDARLGSLVTARCTRDSGQREVELTLRRPCPPPDRGASKLWAVNLSCAGATGFPFGELTDVDERRPPEDPCAGGGAYYPGRRVTCAVTGYVCALNPVTFGPDPGFRARCTRNDDRSQAIELEAWIP